MTKKKPTKKEPSRKLEEFNETDVKDIIKLGKEKYTVNEIAKMLNLSRKGVAATLTKYNISVPKKPNNIQRLYEQGKLNTDQFFIEASSLIKSRLMPDLIYKGYFRDGERQISYNQEDVEDCYTYVLSKILTKYDPEKGTLATFIRNWTRGYGTTVTTAQHRRYNKVGNDSSLDESYNNSICDDFRDSFSFSELEESIDNERFSGSLTYSTAIEKEMIYLKDKYFKTILKGLQD